MENFKDMIVFFREWIKKLVEGIQYVIGWYEKNEESIKGLAE